MGNRETVASEKKHHNLPLPWSSMDSLFRESLEKADPFLLKIWNPWFGIVWLILEGKLGAKPRKRGNKLELF